MTAGAMSIPLGSPIGVVGAGTMGIGIAETAAFAGHQVLLYDLSQAMATENLSASAERLRKRVERGKVDHATAESAISRISVVASIDELAKAGLIIEAIVEDLAVKRETIASLETVVSNECVLASNTSSFSISEMAAGAKRPERIAGMHFFNPAQVMPLVEVVSGLETAERVVDSLMETALAWGKKPVRVRSTPGFIVNRVARPFYGEALRLASEGVAEYSTMDTLFRDPGAGFRMGPFELMDLIGNDVNYAANKSIFEAFNGDGRYAPSYLQREYVVSNRLGRKTKRGFYDYGDAANVADVPVVPAREFSGNFRYHPDGTFSVCVKELALGVGTVVEASADLPDGACEVDGVLVFRNDGFAASDLASLHGSPVAVIDSLDELTRHQVLGCSYSESSDSGGLESVAGFFAGIGMSLVRLEDVPGLVLMRTLALLINEASDVVYHGVASASDVDTAVQAGVNYPRGLIDWRRRLGAVRVLEVLDRIYDFYREDRYRASPGLRRAARDHALTEENV